MERKKRKLLGFLRRCKQEARKWWFGYLGGCKQEALEVLKRLRSESEHCIDAGYYHPLKRRLQDVLKEGGLSLADIGTSEEELQGLEEKLIRRK